MIEKGLTPNQDACEALFAGTKNTEEEVLHDTEHHERLQGVLLYMRDNQIYPQHRVASKIKTWFERQEILKMQIFRWMHVVLK